MKEEVIKRLEQTVGNDQFLRNEPMKKHITFRVGGPAACFLTPSTKEQIEEIVHICQEEKTPYFILGNGSNLLVSDQGYDGAVLQIYKNMNQVAVNGEQLQVQAGALLSATARKALDAGLTGMEFAAGIPGTLGGAVVMNAGAYGGEMKDVVVSVNHITDDGAIGRIDKENLEFGYRTSAYRKNNCIITGITLKLKSDNPDDIRHRMDDFMSRRIDKQPLEFPSAGSVFKRPEGNYAGALIEQCGFKGKGVGGAEVSEKHAGFIINKSNATAKDVKELISQIQTTVKKETGYDLECELIML